MSKSLVVAVSLIVSFVFSFPIHAGDASQDALDALDKGMEAMAESNGPEAPMAVRIASQERQTRETPNDADAWRILGNLYFDDDQPEKAIDAYERSLVLHPADPDVLTDLGSMYRRIGRPGVAVEKFDLALSIDPSRVNASFNKYIVLLYDLKDEEGARAAINKLAALNPNATLPNGQTVTDFLHGL